MYALISAGLEKETKKNKEMGLDEERAQSGNNNALDIIESLYGQGFINERNFEDSYTYKRKVRGGKGTDGRRNTSYVVKSENSS